MRDGVRRVDVPIGSEASSYAPVLDMHAMEKVAHAASVLQQERAQLCTPRLSPLTGPPQGRTVTFTWRPG